MRGGVYTTTAEQKFYNLTITIEGKAIVGMGSLVAGGPTCRRQLKRFVLFNYLTNSIGHHEICCIFS